MGKEGEGEEEKGWTRSGEGRGRRGGEGVDEGLGRNWEGEEEKGLIGVGIEKERGKRGKSEARNIYLYFHFFDFY